MSIYGEEIFNDSIKNQLKEYLQQYKNIDRYVTKNDFLLRKPDNIIELMDCGKMAAADHHIGKDNTQRLCDVIKFNRDYERVYVDVKFSYKIKNDVNPQDIFIVFKTDDNKPSSLLYYAYKFSEMTVKSNDENVLRAKTTFFIVDKDIVNYPMSISIYTKQDLDIECSKLRVNIEGLSR